MRFYKLEASLMTVINNRRRSRLRRAWSYLCGHWELYLFLVPGLIAAVMFKLLPMSKIVIAFKNFKPLKGIENSPWVGWANFERMFADPEVWQVIRNTLEINLLQVIFCVPLPMFLAIMLNEVTCMPVKKGVQTLIYIPHFFTWVVVYSVFFTIFGSTGMVNTIIRSLGGKEILFFMKGGWFRFLLVISSAWKGAGWGTIVYLSAITAIDSEIYEAGIIDGASKLQQARHITIPCLLPTLVLMLTVRLGSVLSGGFDQVLAFYNPTVYKSADILGTYIYRQGIGNANFSYAAAVGLFESVVGLVFVMISNFASKRLTGRTVW